MTDEDLKQAAGRLREKAAAFDREAVALAVALSNKGGMQIDCFRYADAVAGYDQLRAYARRILVIANEIDPTPPWAGQVAVDRPATVVG